MDFDPRDAESRDDERWGSDRGRRGITDVCDRDDDWRQPEDRSRDRDHDARTLGRGPGDSRNSHAHYNTRDPYDVRWLERDRGSRERSVDPRDVFTRDLNLPLGLEREIVRYRDHEYTLRGSEARTLATVGAFRVVSGRDVLDHRIDERQFHRAFGSARGGDSFGVKPTF